MQLLIEVCSVLLVASKSSGKQMPTKELHLQGTCLYLTTAAFVGQ
jgi:hypothetical protein